MEGSQSSIDPSVDPKADGRRSVQPPDPLFMSWHRRKSKNPLLNFKEVSPVISDTESRASSTAMGLSKLPTAISSIAPSVDPKADGRRSVKPPDPPSMRRHRRRSISPPLNFKEGSSHMPGRPYMDSGLIHHHPFLSADPPLSTESFKRRHRRKSNSPPLDFKEVSPVISHTESRASSTAMEVPKLPTAIMMPEGPDMVSRLIHHHLRLDPDPPLSTESFKRRHRRKSNSPPPDFKEGSSDMPGRPYMDSGLIHHHPFQPPFPPLSTESFKRRHRRKSNSPPLDFKEVSPVISDTESKASSTAMGLIKLPTAIRLDCNSSSKVKLEAADVGSFQSPFRPSSMRRYHRKLNSPPPDFKEGSSLMKSDEVIQEFAV